MRGLIGALVALVFAIAAEPGAMAMPAQRPMAMDCAHHAAPPCNHMKPLKEQGTPCKGMTMCLGMFSCFGMTAVAIKDIAPANGTVQILAPRLDESAHGLTYPPDNPPPIA